ncbi:MAG TPA: recombinase RecB, partial [Actinopolymorphaceae bacterium]
EEAADADAAYADLDSAGREERFPPRPGPLCQWCDFAQHCPEGRAAYPTRRSWEGLDPEV